MDGKIKSMFDAEPHRQHLCDAIFPNDDRHDDADDGAVVAAYIILPTPRPWLEECEKQPAKKTKKKKVANTVDSKKAGKSYFH